MLTLYKLCAVRTGSKLLLEGVAAGGVGVGDGGLVDLGLVDGGLGVLVSHCCRVVGCVLDGTQICGVCWCVCCLSMCNVCLGSSRGSGRQNKEKRRQRSGQA